MAPTNDIQLEDGFRNLGMDVTATLESAAFESRMDRSGNESVVFAGPADVDDEDDDLEDDEDLDDEDDEDEDLEDEEDDEDEDEEQDDFEDEEDEDEDDEDDEDEDDE